MSVDDSGWGSDDGGWQEQPSSPLPPPPGASGPPGAPRHGRARKPLIYGAIGVAVILVALIVIGLAVGPNKPKHHLSTATTLRTATSPTSVAASVTTLAAPTPSTTPTPTTTPTSTESVDQELLAAVPLTGCQVLPASEYLSQEATGEVLCGTGSNASAIDAGSVGYTAFSSQAAMTDEYSAGFVQPNNVTSGSGSCQTLSLTSTSNDAQYCEGPVTDANGQVGRAVLIVAPLTAPVIFGHRSTATDCAGSSGYTLMLFTLPSDGVLGAALSCSDSSQVAQTFQTALTKGYLDLKS